MIHTSRLKVVYGRIPQTSPARLLGVTGLLRSSPSALLSFKLESLKQSLAISSQDQADWGAGGFCKWTSTCWGNSSGRIFLPTLTKEMQTEQCFRAGMDSEEKTEGWQTGRGLQFSITLFTRYIDSQVDLPLKVFLGETRVLFLAHLPTQAVHTLHTFNAYSVILLYG